MTVFSNNPTMDQLVRVEFDVTFSEAVPGGLKLTILKPYQENPQQPYPCVLFTQGSGFTFPVVGHELVQLGPLAASGIVVAMVTHRNTLEGHRFPACLQDVKTALRFMRVNADRWHIDPERIGMWGTSSGGHMSLMTVLTQGEEEYQTAEYAGISERVKFVVDCFGPTDLYEVFQVSKWPSNLKLHQAMIVGHEQDEKELLDHHSPLYRVRDDGEYPPFLILHGTDDVVVPYHQSQRLAERLEQAGAKVDFVRIEGGGHENDFWSKPVFEYIFDFIHQNI